MKRWTAGLLSLILLLSLFSCGDPMEGPVESFTGEEESEKTECFFGSTEELRGLYDAIGRGDRAVKEFVTAREAEKQYMDDLPLADTAAKARSLLKDPMDLPLAAFPEESFSSVYYFHTVRHNEPGGTEFRIQYNLNEHGHFRERKYFTVEVNYNLPQDVLETYQTAYMSMLVETFEVDGYEMKVFMSSGKEKGDDGSEKTVFHLHGSILIDGSETAIYLSSDDAKEGIRKLHKVRITTLREILGLDEK